VWSLLATVSLTSTLLLWPLVVMMGMTATGSVGFPCEVDACRTDGAGNSSLLSTAFVLGMFAVGFILPIIGLIRAPSRGARIAFGLSLALSAPLVLIVAVVILSRL
jgi:hypothetical protein